MDTIEDCVSAALGALDLTVRTKFAEDPLSAMTNDLRLRVQRASHLSEQRADGGMCDGMSFVKDGVILYAPSPTSRRENFTLAHELGHWLLDRVQEVFDWLARQREPERALETLCDLIAQRLLLPEDAIKSVIGGGPVRARNVTDLFASGQASTPVCAIALARHIPQLGAVVITRVDSLSGDPVVEYASIRPDPVNGWPKVYPWRGQAVPAGHPIKSVQVATPVQRKTFWSMPWGESAEFYMDAVATPDGRVVAILADTDLWGIEKFHAAPAREYDQRVRQDITCCGATRSARGYPCPTCGTVPCPQCGLCKCQRQDAELVPCAKCSMAYRQNLLIEGLCEECR